MPIDRITSSQFLDRLRTALLARSRRYDTGYGPIKDVVMLPVADVLEDQNNNRLRRVSLLLSLLNENEFSEADLDALVYNEGIIRPSGSQAEVTLTFKRQTPFTASESGVIPRGFPVASSADEVSGQATTFITTESRDKTSAVAMIDEDTNLTVYEVAVPALALIRGESGKVGPDRINRPLRPLVGYESVTNKEASQEGRDRYSNRELIELYFLAISSRQLSVPGGNEFHVRDNFSSVVDINEVTGSDPLLTRGADDAGAVDAFVITDSEISDTDQIAFLGVGQLMELSLPPVIRVDTVTRISDSTVFVEDEDYEVVLDSSGVSGSTRARDGIRFLPSADPMPAIGDAISVVYTYNQLVRDLQADAEDPEVAVDGRDLLFRLGSRVDVFLTAELTVLGGFTFSTIQAAVEDALVEYINDLGLGDDVEGSDLQAVVRAISGVDNFVITKLTRSASATGTSDITIDGNEYARIEEANLSIV